MLERELCLKVVLSVTKSFEFVFIAHMVSISSQLAFKRVLKALKSELRTEPI